MFFMANQVTPSKKFYKVFVDSAIKYGWMTNFMSPTKTSSFAKQLCYDEEHPENSYDSGEIEKTIGIVTGTIDNFFKKVFPELQTHQAQGKGVTWIKEFPNFAKQVGLLEFENVFENLDRNYLYDIAKVLLFLKNWALGESSHLFKSIGRKLKKENTDQIKNEYKIQINKDFPYPEFVGMCEKNDELLDLLCKELEEGREELKEFRTKFEAYKGSMFFESEYVFARYLEKYDEYIKEHKRLSSRGLKVETYEAKYNGEQVQKKVENPVQQSKPEEEPKDEFMGLALEYAKCIAENLQTSSNALENYNPRDHYKGEELDSALRNLSYAVPMFDSSLSVKMTEADGFEWEDQKDLRAVHNRLEKISKGGENASADQKALATYLLELEEYLVFPHKRDRLKSIPDVPEEPKNLSQYGMSILGRIRLTMGDTIEKSLGNQFKMWKQLIEKKVKATKDEVEKYNHLKNEISAFTESIEKCSEMVAEKSVKKETILKKDVSGLQDKAESLKQSAKLVSADYVLKLLSSALENTPENIPSENDADKFSEETESKLKEPVGELRAAIIEYLNGLGDKQKDEIKYENSKLKKIIIEAVKKLDSGNSETTAEYPDRETIQDYLDELGDVDDKFIGIVYDIFKWVTEAINSPGAASQEPNFEFEESLFSGSYVLKKLYKDLKELVDKTSEKLKKYNLEEKIKKSAQNYEGSDFKKLINEANEMLSKKPSQMGELENMSGDKITGYCKELGISDYSVIDHINNFFIWFSSIVSLMANKNSSAETFTKEIMNFQLDGGLLSGSGELDLIKTDLSNLVHMTKKKVHDYKEAKEKESKSLRGRIKNTAKTVSTTFKNIGESIKKSKEKSSENDINKSEHTNESSTINKLKTRVSNKVKSVIPEWARDARYIEEEQKNYKTQRLQKLFGDIGRSVYSKTVNKEQYDLCKIFKDCLNESSVVPLIGVGKNDNPKLEDADCPTSVIGLSRAVSKVIKKNSNKIVCLSERELLRIYLIIAFYTKDAEKFKNNPSCRRNLIRDLKQENVRLKTRSKLYGHFSNVYKPMVVAKVSSMIKTLKECLR